MGVIRLTGRALALLCLLLGLGWAAAAQGPLYAPPSSAPESAFEFHDGTVRTSSGRVRMARVKLVLRKEGETGDKDRFATLVVETPTGLVRPDSAVGFSFERRRFVHLSTLTADRGLRGDLNTEFVEVIQDTGRIELYGYYPLRGNQYVLAAYTPGVIHEDDLVRAFIWRRRGGTNFDVLPRLPPRGYNDAFERQLRALFADRPDLLKYLDSHDIRRGDLPAAVRAYNSGLPIRFE